MLQILLAYFYLLKSLALNYNLPQKIEHVDPKVLPAPKVCVSHLKPGSISVQWHLTSLPPRSIRLSHYVVTLIGTEFSSSIKSDSRYTLNHFESNDRSFNVFYVNFLKL